MKFYDTFNKNKKSGNEAIDMREAKGNEMFENFMMECDTEIRDG